MPERVFIDVIDSFLLWKVHLGALGLRVFLDVEGLAQGSFEDGLGKALEMSRAVVVVLSESSLDRCISDVENQDWVRT